MKQEDPKKFDLKIDFREQQSGIVGEIEKLTDQLTIELGMLSVGDYWIGDKIIVERKTLSDFLSSIKTGRIYHRRGAHQRYILSAFCQGIEEVSRHL